MDNTKFHTPHIKAVPGDFAKTVLMPGDPLRAKFIAETFLTDAKLVNHKLQRKKMLQNLTQLTLMLTSIKINQAIWILQKLRV